MKEQATEAPKTEKPAKVEMPEQNGIRQPKPGTSCAQIWDRANTMSGELGAAVAVGDLMTVLVAEGYNESTIKTQYARWRKFHGVEGRIESDAAKQKKADRETAKANKAKEREDAKAKREEAKQAKVAEREAAKKQKEADKLAKAEAKAKEKAEKEAAKAEAKKVADAKKEADAKAKAAQAQTKGE